MGNQNSMSPRRKKLLLLLRMVCFLMWGCCPPNALEQDYGRSVRNNLAQQLVNPQAGFDLRPAVGLPPKAGVYEMDRYDKSFKKEEQAAPSIFGLAPAQGASAGQSAGY